MINVTSKEGVVVALVARGLVSKEIAGELHIDEETVEDRIRRAMRRTGARTRAHLVALFLRRTRKSVCSPSGEQALSLWADADAA